MRISDWSSDVCSSDLLILERATGRGDQRRQRLFLRRRNPVRDEPAKKTVHHPGSGQAQLAKLGASPRGRRPHLLPARPAKSQMVENLGTMPSPGTAKPVIDFQLCRRCSDLLGEIRNNSIRKLVGTAPKASRRPAKHPTKA